MDWRRLNYILVPYFTRRRDEARARKQRLPRALLFVALTAERISSEGAYLVALMFLAAPLALDVRRNHLYLAWAATTGLLLASILVSRGLRLTGVRARVVAPRRVMVGEAVELRVVLANDGALDHVSLRSRGPFLSWDGQWVERARGLQRLAPRTSTELVFRARFTRRGLHELGSFRVQALVPFGLALGPPLRTERTQLLVLPRVANVTALTVAEPRRHHKGGVPRAARHADSRELAGIRPYRAGDPVKDLHARTWARTGQPFVREYQEEFFAHVAVWVDTACGELDVDRHARARLEGGLSLAAGILSRLLDGEALVDLFLAGDSQTRDEGTHRRATGEPLALGRGRGTIDAALEALASASSRTTFDAPSVRAAFAPHLGELSALIAIVPVWDEARRALVKELERAGLACSVFLLDATHVTDAGLPRVRVLDPAAILRGDPVS